MTAIFVITVMSIPCLIEKCLIEKCLIEKCLIEKCLEGLGPARSCHCPRGR